VSLTERLGRGVLSIMLGMLAAGCGSWVVKKVATDEAEETPPETERFVDAPVCHRTPIRNLSGQWVGATEDGTVWSFQAVQRGEELDVATGSRVGVMHVCGRHVTAEWPNARLPSSFVLHATSDGCKIGGHVVWASGDSAYVALRRKDCPSVADPLEEAAQGDPRMDDPFEAPQDEEDELDEPRDASAAP
jgi:hypothetical protein